MVFYIYIYCGCSCGVPQFDLSLFLFMLDLCGPLSNMYRFCANVMN